MSLFNKLMKSKGLLGGKYSVGLDEEVVNIILDSFDTEEEIAKTQGGRGASPIERMKRKVKEIVDDEEKKDGPRSSTPPRPVSVGGVITSPVVGFLRVQEEFENIDKTAPSEGTMSHNSKVSASYLRFA